MTILPTFVDPVNEINGILLSSVIFCPIYTLPIATVNTLGLILFFYRISPITVAQALVIREALGAGFQHIKSPQIIAIAAFHPKTAHGKLKAVMTPTIPNGFQTSIIKCSGLSEFKTLPPIVLDNPQAISQISMNSWTYPRPSVTILPIYNESTLPKAYFFALNASPICLTISPLAGIGREAHSALAAYIALIAWSYS